MSAEVPMAREAELFEMSNGSPADAFWALMETGANVPPNWIERARESRKAKEKELAKKLKAGELSMVMLVKEWETYYRKECFYRGIRALMELTRSGKTDI
jgi:hypothetical protein